MVLGLGRRAVLMCSGALLALGCAAPGQAQLLSLGDVIDALVDVDARVTLNTGAITVINADLDAQRQIIDGLTVNVADLFGRVDQNSAAIIAANAALTAQASTIVANTARINGQAGVLAAVDARLAGQEGLIGTLQGVTADLAADVAANVGLTVDLSNRVDAATGSLTLTDNSVRIGEIRNDLTLVDNRVTQINVRIDAVEGDLVALDQRVTVNANAIVAVNAVAVAARDDAADLRNRINAGTIGLVQQQGPQAPVTVAATTGGTVVTFAGTDGDRRLTGVAAGIAANDAATVGQVGATAVATLGAANSYTDTSIAALESRIGDSFGLMLSENNAVLRKDMNTIAAGSSALAGLPQSFIPGQGMMSASVGGKGDAVAFALGLSKAFDAEHTPVVKAGAAIDSRYGTVSYNAAVGFHF